MDDLPYSLQVFVIILGAAAVTVMGYAVWRIRFNNPGLSASRFDMSDAQKEYLRTVRESNNRAIMAFNGIRYQ